MQNSVFFGTTKKSIKPLTKERENQIKDVNKEKLTHISTQGMRRRKIREQQQQQVTEHEDDNRTKNSTHLSKQNPPLYLSNRELNDPVTVPSTNGPNMNKTNKQQNAIFSTESTTQLVFSL